MISPACEVRIRLPTTCGRGVGFGPSSRTSSAWPKPPRWGSATSVASSVGVPEAVPTTRLYRYLPVEPLEPMWLRELGGDLEGLVDEREKAAFREESDRLADRLAIDEEEERGQRHDAIFPLNRRIRVDVHRAHLEVVRALARDLIEDRREH